MDIKYRLYPYPVLAEFNNSYENVEFTVKAEMERDGFDIVIRVSVNLTDTALREFIENGKATLVYHLECAQTGYREIKKTDKYECTIPIKSSKVSGELHFCPFIIAQTELLNYYNPNFNAYYSEPIKKIELGCILAVGKQHNWPVKKSMQDIVHSSSPFRILPNIDESQNQMIVEYESMKRIKIKLRAEDFALYKSMKKDPRLKDILNSAIVIPALVYVLGQLQKSDADELEANYADLPWYISIKDTLQKNFRKDITNLRDENIFELAQKMLKTPINSAIENLANVGNNDKGEEEDD